jgi:uncharacterized protein (DUF1778 family)
MARTVRKWTTSREAKTARMELRVAPAAKAVIRRAMVLSGRSAADLAYEGAKQVLEEHERMVLRGRDREVFLTAVKASPPPKPRLTAALRRHSASTR